VVKGLGGGQTWEGKEGEGRGEDGEEANDALGLENWGECEGKIKSKSGKMERVR